MLLCFLNCQLPIFLIDSDATSCLDVKIYYWQLPIGHESLFLMLGCQIKQVCSICSGPSNSKGLNHILKAKFQES